MNVICKRSGLIALCIALLCVAVRIDRIFAGFASVDPTASVENTREFKFDSDAALADFDMWYAPTLTPDGEFPAISGADDNWYINNGKLLFAKNNKLFLDSDALLYAEDDLVEDFKVYKYATAIDSTVAQANQFNNPKVTAGPLAVENGVTVQNKEGNLGSVRDLGYLDFVGGFYNKDVTHTLTHKQMVTEFMLEVDILVDKAQNAGGKGIMIAPAGGYAFRSDGDASNDTGIYITIGSNMLPVVVGAIDPSTATVTKGGTFTDRTRWPLTQEPMKSADTALCADTAIGTLATEYKAVHPTNSAEIAEAGKVTLCIEIKDGKLRVWNKAAADVNVLTVDLNGYEGGCVSYVASSVFHGSLRGMRLKDYVAGDAEKTWDYSYSVTRNVPVAAKDEDTGDAYGEVEIPAIDLLDPTPDNANNAAIAVDAVRKTVTYKSADQNTAYHSNYGIAVLNTRTYNSFELEVDVKGNTHWTMVGFGAQNTSNGVFPSQQNGGYALYTDNTGVAKLVGGTAADTVWNECASGTVSGYTEKDTHQYKIKVDAGNTATVTVDGTQVLTYQLPQDADGYVYLAANDESAGFGNLKITDLDAAGETATYTFNTVKELEQFTMWYMPVGKATEKVPAIKLENIDHTGNWYIENNTLCFLRDGYLYKTADALEAGVEMTVDTEAGEQNILYKSTDDEINNTGNFGIAMLNLQKYKDFRLEVDVVANAARSYIGFGAEGGSYGTHIGQSGGGYAFHTQPYSASENLGLAMVSSYDSLNGGQYALARSGTFAYDTTKDHHYVIEVKDGVVTATVDGEAVSVKTVLPMYEGGYIYLASNCEGGGFYNLKITELEALEEQLPVDISNTVTYSFDKESDLDAFEYWYAYGATDNDKPAIPVTEEDGANWYIDRQQTLSFKENKLYVKENADTKKIEVTKELTIDGETKSYDFVEDTLYPTYNGNFGIAVLKTPYENFILEVDMKPTNRHIYVGFGAKGGHYGVFRTHVDGGYALRINKDGSKDAAKAIVGNYTGQWFANKANVSVDPFPYSEGSYRHLRLVVSDGAAHYYFDDSETPITVYLDEAYAGGHIWFAVNYQTGGFDNIQITDLDKKEIEIADIVGEVSSETPEINRAEDQSLSDIIGGPIDVVDKYGYGYNVPVQWASETYRSYIGGEHAFILKNGPTGWHNITVNAVASDKKITVINNLNEEGYDSATSRKYYFDHDNDLLDFISQYSQEQEDGTMSGWNGELLPDENCSVWTTATGALTNTAPVNPGTWNAKNRTTVHSLLLDDLHLYNFRLEMDYYHAKDNWWYTYLIFGAQDPSLSYIGQKNDTVAYTATDAGGNRNCGVWSWVEQEGRIHNAGDVFSSDEYQPQQLNWMEDIDGSLYIDKYPDTRNDKHHVTIEVVNGEAWIQVDDSGKYYFIPLAQALGGYMGVATHRSGSIIDNFQITALDENGEEMNLEDAPQGFAPEIGDDYAGWGANREGDAFEWGPEYTY